MNKLLKHGMALLAIGMSASIANATNSETELWYSTPASEWMEALPIGNGRLGAMVYGGISQERIALNEITMWSGQRDSLQNDNCGPSRLSEIRTAFFSGDIAQGNELTRKYLSGRSASFGTHLPVGDLVIDFSSQSPDISGYRRSLDLADAVATTTYQSGDVQYKREYICDYPDDILAVRISADKKGAVSATLYPELLREAGITTSDNGIIFDGKVSYHMFGPGGVNFIGNITIDADGGSILRNDGSVTVTNADTLTILIDIRTDYTSTMTTRRLPPIT